MGGVNLEMLKGAKVLPTQGNELASSYKTTTAPEKSGIGKIGELSPMQIAQQMVDAKSRQV
jgi:hypothetical protein